MVTIIYSLMLTKMKAYESVEVKSGILHSMSCHMMSLGEAVGRQDREYRESGDDSALHIIILDEIDAIARKRGSMTSDTIGVRDSVVKQLLAKMDGVKEASNVLVVALNESSRIIGPSITPPRSNGSAVAGRASWFVWKAR